MKITCPACAAEYEIPGQIGPGRVVKCARCGSQWAPVAPLPPPPPAPLPPPAPPPPVIEPEAEPIRTPAPPVIPPPAPLAARPELAPKPRTAPLLIAWAASLVLIVALAIAAVIWHEPIMRAWPPSIRVYERLGFIAPP